MPSIGPISGGYQFPRTHRGSLLDSPGILALHRYGEASGVAAADERGLYPGVYTGTPTLGVAGLLAGDPGTAVTFNGTTQYEQATVPTGPALGWTLGCVAKPASINQFGCIAYHGVNPNGRGLFIGGLSGTVNTGAKLMIIYSTVGWPADGTVAFTFPDITSAHHLIITNDGTTTSVYVDGIPVYADTTLAPSQPAPTATTAMQVVSVPARFFAGTVQDRFLLTRGLSPLEAAHLARVALLGPTFP
jgi:hypothetical protein